MCKYCKCIQEKHFSQPQDGDLKVWWIPQVPMNPFEYPVESIKEAKVLLGALAQYDLFQLEHNVKPDYSNVGGLQVWDSNWDGAGNPGWCEWQNDDGCDIDEVDENGETIEED